MALLSMVAAAVAFLALACASDAAPSPEVRVDLSPMPTTVAFTPTAASSPSPKPLPSPTPTPRRVSLSGLGGHSQVPDLPFPFAAPVAEPALEALIVETLGQDLPSYSVVVHHLGDGRSAAVNEAQVYYAASLYKLALLLEAYHQREAGEIDFSQELVLEEKYVEYDLGTLELLGLLEGDIITVADAVRAMIVVSDTPTSIMIQDLLGPARVEEMLRSLGLSETHYTTGLPVSARDMARLLEAIAAGEGVSEASRREMLSLLLSEQIRDGIPSGLPAGTPVAHKTGNWNNATHDVALVWSKGGAYIIVILSDQPWRWEPIVAISRAVYDYFAENPSLR